MQVNATKICPFAMFPQLFQFSMFSSKTLISQLFVPKIFSFLNLFVSARTKCDTYLNKPASKSCRFV